MDKYLDDTIAYKDGIINGGNIAIADCLPALQQVPTLSALMQGIFAHAVAVAKIMRIQSGYTGTNNKYRHLVGVEPFLDMRYVKPAINVELISGNL